jgi:hypothetical protein
LCCGYAPWVGDSFTGAVPPFFLSSAPASTLSPCLLVKEKTGGCGLRIAQIFLLDRSKGKGYEDRNPTTFSSFRKNLNHVFPVERFYRFESVNPSIVSI